MSDHPSPAPVIVLVAFAGVDGEPGPVRVVDCPLCRALVLVDGLTAHGRWHADTAGGAR